MKRKATTRIIAIILAALMVLGGVTILVAVFSGDAGAAEPGGMAIPRTGLKEDWVFYVIGGAVLVAAACMILPRVIKPKPPKNDDDDEF